QRFGDNVRVAVTRENAVATAGRFLAQRNIPVENYRNVAWLTENIDPAAVKYLFEHETVQQASSTYQQATRLLLWEVRYFRPEEKEEHWVAVDASNGEVFAYQHLLDENAPGASLSPDAARMLAQESLSAHGYAPDDFGLENSEPVKRKARQDYTFTWQAKPGDP